jgi:hypothetical protein
VHIDEARLMRAMKLRVNRVGLRQYEVGTWPKIEYVDLMEGDPCHCADAMLRSFDELTGNLVCKHILACLLFEKHPRIVKKVAEILEKGENPGTPKVARRTRTPQTGERPGLSDEG